MRLFNDMVSGDPRLRQAGHLPRQRHAHRRRAGNRHGLRLHHRPGPGALRPGGPAATAARPTAAPPTSCTSSSASSTPCSSCTACEPWSAHKALPPGPGHRGRARAEGRRASSCRTRWCVTDRCVDAARARSSTASRRRARRSRRARRCWRRARSTSRALDAAVERLCAKLLMTFPDCTTRTLESHPQEEARALGQEQGRQPRLARAQHDDRGAGRLHRLPLRREEPRDRLRRRCASGSPRARPGTTRMLEAIEPVGARPADPPSVSGQDAARDERRARLDVLRLTLDAARATCSTRSSIDGARARSSRRRSSDADAARGAARRGRQRTSRCGASVEEHRPEQVRGDARRASTRWCWTMLELPVPLLVAVQGRCLGGGLELALAGSRLFAAPGRDASGSRRSSSASSLPRRARCSARARRRAARRRTCLLTGRTVNAEEAAKLGLVDELCAGRRRPTPRARLGREKHLLPLLGVARLRAGAPGRARRAGAVGARARLPRRAASGCTSRS